MKPVKPIKVQYEKQGQCCHIFQGTQKKRDTRDAGDTRGTRDTRDNKGTQMTQEAQGTQEHTGDTAGTRGHKRHKGTQGTQGTQGDTTGHSRHKGTQDRGHSEDKCTQGTQETLVTEGTVSKIVACLCNFYKNVWVKNKETSLLTNHLGRKEFALDKWLRSRGAFWQSCYEFQQNRGRPKTIISFE